MAAPSVKKPLLSAEACYFGKESPAKRSCITIYIITFFGINFEADNLVVQTVQ
jgi:hypothetical protein